MMEIRPVTNFKILLTFNRENGDYTKEKADCRNNTNENVFIAMPISMSDKVSLRVDCRLSFVELILSRRGGKKNSPLVKNSTAEYTRRVHDVLNIQRASTRWIRSWLARGW